jgi:hypothetical protein
MAITALGISGRSVHEPVHARDLVFGFPVTLCNDAESVAQAWEVFAPPACPPPLPGEVPGCR